MKNLLISLIAVLFIFSTANALTVLDFEDVPEQYWYFGGGQNLDGFYPGLNFGTSVTILENVVYGYNDTGYPPHSGHQVIFSADNATIRVDFDNPTNHVGFWYTNGSGTLYLEGYDAGGNLLDNTSGGDNYGSNDFMEVNADGITYVLIHNSADFYTIDDFEYEGEVPCCDVDMTPDDDPVIVEPGGQFGLTGYIGNPTADPITTDVWGGVIYQGMFFQQFAFNNIPLDPGASLSAHTWQNVPGFAPTGTYEYIAYCGDRPDMKCDSASFPFSVVGARVAGGADEWYMDEWGFPNGMTTDNVLPRVSQPADEPIITDIYNPSLALTIQHTLPVTPMSVVSDGNYYWMNDGGIIGTNEIEKYELDGTFIQEVIADPELDQRGFFYNPNDGKFYIKDYYDNYLSEIDPNTGVNSVYLTGAFHDQQSCLAFDPDANLIYELAYGTVYAIDFASGSTVNSWSGVTGNYAIAWNGCHFFTRDWDDVVYVYDTDFNLIETHDLGHGGSNAYSLSFANNLLWAIESGAAYGYAGFECEMEPCCDVDMTPDDDPVIVPPGGSFGLTGYIGNPTADPIVTDVWGGVIYLGNFYQQFSFPNISLAPGASLTAH
ncbi:MAG: hypothetical protein GF315_10445, partial [candidate division Zixibacteria bacterium]|nr:hypothetical protein [candidate division Zixibacteria bacterium]